MPLAAEPAPSESPVLEFVAVSVVADDGTVILDGVQASVVPSAVTVVAGPSGAGKSTLLRLGNRLEVPTSGVVRFHGTDVSVVDPRELRRRVGMVFQRPVVFAGTVRENLQVARPEAAEAVLADALDRVGLDPSLLGRTADDLSGGEAQRMCIARALLTGPEALLMDEPTSSLDPGSRREIERLVRRLAESGLAVVWVSHDLAQVRRLADATVVLVDGRAADAAATERYLGSETEEGPS